MMEELLRNISFLLLIGIVILVAVNWDNIYRAVDAKVNGEPIATERMEKVNTGPSPWVKFWNKLLLVLIIIVPLILFFLFAKYIFNYREVVPVKEFHLVTRRKRTWIYSGIKFGAENYKSPIYYRFPKWMPWFGVAVDKYYTKKYQNIYQNTSVYDSEATVFKLTGSLEASIEDPIKAVQSTAIKPEEFKQLTSKQIDDIIDDVARNFTVREILQRKDLFSKDILLKLRDPLKEIGFSVYKFNITAFGGDIIDLINREEVERQRLKTETEKLITDESLAVKQKDVNQKIIDAMIVLKEGEGLAEALKLKQYKIADISGETKLKIDTLKEAVKDISDAIKSGNDVTLILSPEMLGQFKTLQKLFES